MSARRFPGWVFSHGTEPDPRFTLANERTFLAWIRTALALAATGIALEAVPMPMTEAYRWSASFSLIMLGMLLPGVAWLSWAITERALRRGEPLPSSRVAPLLAAGVAAAAAIILAGGAAASDALIRLRFRHVQRSLTSGRGTRTGGRSLLLLAGTAFLVALTGVFLLTAGTVA